MFGLPLHPLVVHFPLVWAMILPIIAIWMIWRFRQGTGNKKRIWAGWVAAQALLALSAFIATQTGGRDEEKVEKVVPEASLESHEEQGERFALVTAGATLVSLGGFLPPPLGQAAQVLSWMASLGQVGMVIPLGHSGASLVYRHGAASAFIPKNQGQPQDAIGGAKSKDDDD